MGNSDLIIIPVGASALALTREEFELALSRGREITASYESEKAPSSSDESILSAEQAEKHTGVPASWFLEAARNGRIPYVRFGKYVRFRLSDLTQALEVRGR